MFYKIIKHRKSVFYCFERLKSMYTREIWKILSYGSCFLHFSNVLKNLLNRSLISSKSSSVAHAKSFADVLALRDFQSISFFFEINTAVPEEYRCRYASGGQGNNSSFLRSVSEEYKNII